MTKTAIYKPTIYFFRGWWRVRRADTGDWSGLRNADKVRISQAHNHVDRLNKTEMARAMRSAYYDRLAKEKAAERVLKQKAFAMTATLHPDGPVSPYDLLNGR